MSNAESPEAAIVVVEEAFVTRGSGVMILPRLTFDGTNGSFAVVLRLPNGDERAATASFETSHIRGASAPFAMLRIADLKPEDVPAGTVVMRAR